MRYRNAPTAKQSHVRAKCDRRLHAALPTVRITIGIGRHLMAMVIHSFAVAGSAKKDDHRGYVELGECFGLRCFGYYAGAMQLCK